MYGILAISFNKSNKYSLSTLLCAKHCSDIREYIMSTTAEKSLYLRESVLQQRNISDNKLNSILKVSECYGGKGAGCEIGGMGRVGQASFLNSVFEAGLTKKTSEPRLEKSESTTDAWGNVPTRRNQLDKSPGA